MVVWGGVTRKQKDNELRIFFVFATLGSHAQPFFFFFFFFVPLSEWAKKVFPSTNKKNRNLTNITAIL